MNTKFQAIFAFVFLVSVSLPHVRASQVDYRDVTQKTFASAEYLHSDS